jgi:hypothetical protein
MNFKAIVASWALVMNAPPATAQNVGECDGSSVSHILNEMSEGAFMSFANGAIRIADVYVDAHLASSVVVVVMHPRLSDLHGAGYYQACTAVYSTRTLLPYFGQVFLRRATATYEADTGLTLSVPVRYDYWDRASEDGILTLTVNQKLGEVIVQER